MKLRIKVSHDCFEGTYYTIQKRVFLFYWSDLSGWFHDLSKAVEEKERMQVYFDTGVIE